MDDVEDFVATYLAIGLEHPNLDGYPRTLSRDLGRLSDGIWVPTILSQRLIEWSQGCHFVRQEEWDISLDGIIQIIDNQVLEQFTPVVCHFINELMLLHRCDIYPSIIVEEVVSFLNQIGPRVLVALLGIRTTVGCVEDCLPPPKWKLLAAFDRPHNENSGSQLSAGARALSKHFHRGKEGWWGSSKGNDITKNASAHKFCEKILEHPIWINLHQMVGEVKIVEYRISEGYGARWALRSDIEECTFRGFLEPHSIDGHEKSWRH